MAKKIIRLSESRLRTLIEGYVRKAILEAVEGGDDYSKFGEFGPYIKMAADFIWEKVDNKKDDYLQSADWDDDDSCQFSFEDEVDSRDLGVDLTDKGIESFCVFYVVEGAARQTYYRSADYYQPAESAGTGSATIYMDKIGICYDDGSEDEMTLDIELPEIDLDW